MRVPLSHWYTPLRAEANDPLLVSPFTHLYETHLPKTSVRKTLDTGSNCTRPSCKPLTLIPLAGRIQGGKHRRDLKQWELSQNPCKGMTPPLTQNLKALSLWVFFLICCSNFSFVLNVGLRLTLEYLTIFVQVRVPLSHWYTLLRAEAFSMHEYLTHKDLHSYCRLHT